MLVLVLEGCVEGRERSRVNFSKEPAHMVAHAARPSTHCYRLENVETDGGSQPSLKWDQGRQQYPSQTKLKTWEHWGSWCMSRELKSRSAMALSLWCLLLERDLICPPEPMDCLSPQVMQWLCPQEEISDPSINIFKKHTQRHSLSF